MRFFPVVIALFVSACGTPTILEAKDYKQSCTKNSECVAVYLGEVCKPCLCNNDAIAAEQSKIYEADFTGAQRSCSGPIPAVACGPCEAKAAVCDNGTCTLQ
ncbi:MAG: hypothetical protein DI536_01555 [Archangium gephyra]|uniref:Lipoprotein n=1 Tax=Archangium gephyra TaxID=48 RepID=A0A2W5VSE5_9BACT|nr:MAG: hypothetical protein DI536_01555 [Archangium gephyra]